MMGSKMAMRVGVIDFFCGCGGTSSGFAAAKVPGATVEIVAGVDIDPYCCATFERMLRVPAECLDIVEIADNRRLRNALLRGWNLSRFDKLILVGCAPCQGFAAHRKAIDGRDRRRSLFVVFSQLVAALKPDAVFMENVPDLFSKRHWRYYEHGRHLLESSGYFVRSRIYNFAGFGLPQERFRAVMMAFPNPFDVPVPYLDHQSYRTVREAISHLPHLNSGEYLPGDPMHIVSRHRPETLKLLSVVPPDGGNRPVGVGPRCLDRARALHGGYTDVYGRLAWDKPAVTITARCRTPSCGRFAHPEQHRGLSVREAALLQGFPPKYYFEGPFDDKYKQIGNAVPPLVARHFGEHMIRRLLRPSRARVETGGDITGPVGAGFAVTINGIKRRRGRDGDGRDAAADGY